MPSVMLSALSQDKPVSLELEVMPDEAHIIYSRIMGQEIMHDLQIDTKIATHDIMYLGRHSQAYGKLEILV